MSYDDFDDNNAVNQELNGKVPAVNDMSKADESAKGEKPLNELQIALKDKFVAESTFVKGPQTRKTDAETTLLEVRKLEAQAEIKRLEVERARLAADERRLDVERLRLLAETRFTDGARTYREEMDGRAAKSAAFMNYASVFGKVLMVAFQAGIVACFIYLFFVVFR